MKTVRRSLAPLQAKKRVEVKIGSTAIGGDNPIAIQTMTNTNTMDTDACIAQIERIRNAGCRIVRLTAPGRQEAENLKNIAAALRSRGYADVALVADIHFTPDVALIAAEYVDKVRINPGNYRNDKGQFRELIKKCSTHNVAIRIGVNHGSLAPHMVQKWGDTPQGMVESALEFLKECRRENFDQVVVSMKSSNVRVMVHAYRLLYARMALEGMNYPIHLGVTEAGNGAEGRIKSAVGIGALLVDGIGDTIRVSLTEDPENEIPVAQSLVDYIGSLNKNMTCEPTEAGNNYSPFEYRRRLTTALGKIGATNPSLLYSELDDKAKEAIENGEIVLLTAQTENPAIEWREKILDMISNKDLRPVILHRTYNESSIDSLQIKASIDFGTAFIDGLADGIWIENLSDNPAMTQEQLDQTALAILQAARARMSRTEYIACPGCGRTLFNLQSTLDSIKRRTSHLKHLKIGVMGCIVNGPGEMADADYGYVGAGAGRVTLYKNKEIVMRNVPQEEAIDALINVIQENGDWIEPGQN